MNVLLMPPRPASSGILRRWYRFFAVRKLMLVLRDNTGLALFSLLLAVVLPIISVRGARQLADFITAAVSAGASVPIAGYSALFLFWQTIVIVFALLYIARANRRPLQYMFLPVSYQTYLALCVRRVVVATVAVSAVFYGPLLLYAARAVNGRYGWDEALFLVIISTVIAVLASCFYLLFLRVLYTVVNRQVWRAHIPFVAGLAAGAGGVWVLLHGAVFRWWSGFLISASWRGIMVALGVGGMLVFCLKWLLAIQPEAPVAYGLPRADRPAQTAVRHNRRPVSRARVLMTVLGRQFEAHMVTVMLGSLVIGLAAAVRFADNSTGMLAQSVLTPMLPYAAALYGLMARSSLYGKAADSTRYLPVGMPWFALGNLLRSVLWHVSVTLALVAAATAASGLSISFAVILDFVYVSGTTAGIAYVIGTVFYQDTLGSRVAAVALFFGCGAIAQAVLQQMSQYRWGLRLSAFVAAVVVAVIVILLERPRRSRYAGA